MNGRPIVWGVSVSLVTLMLYLPALNNDFVNWDDYYYIYENENIQSLGLDFIRWSLLNPIGGHWHPLTWFSLAMDYAIWGLNPMGFHLTNIILHLLNTFLVFILAAKLIGEGSRAQGPRLDPSTITISAALAALLFGIHPMHVESVAWATERKDVLCLFFFLTAIFSYLTYLKQDSASGPERRIYYIACLILFSISLMAKTTAMILPLVLLILDFYPFHRFEKDAKKVFAEKIPFILLSLGTSFLTLRSAGLADSINNEEFTLITRLFISARGYLFYIVKMSAPINLAPLYPYPLKVNILAFEYLGSAALVLSVTIYCLWSLKKGRVFFAVWMYYLVTLLPVIGIVHTGPQDVADRYTYMPSLGPFILIGLCAAKMCESQRANWRRFASIGSLIIIFCIMGYKTVAQVKIWKDSISLWTHEIKQFNDVETAYLDRGMALNSLGDYQAAVADFNKALKLNPNSARAYNHRGSALYSLGNYKAAISDLDKALILYPEPPPEAYNCRGMAYMGAGDYKSAILDFNRALELCPECGSSYHIKRGLAYSALGSFSAAIKDYSNAIEIDPADAKVYNNRGRAYLELGDVQRAVQDLNMAIEIAPGYAMAYSNLGIVYARLGDEEKGLFYSKKAADLGSGQELER